MKRAENAFLVGLGVLLSSGCSKPEVAYAYYETSSPQLRFLVDRSPIIVHAEISEFGTRLSEMKIRTIKRYKGYFPDESWVSYLNLRRDTELYGSVVPGDIMAKRSFVFFLVRAENGGYPILSIIDFDTFLEKSTTKDRNGDINDRTKTGWRL